MSLKVVILAAGKGRRMFSDLPKVLHPVADKPILQHVIETAQQVAPNNVYVIYGHEGERVTSALQHLNVTWIEQVEKLGTGHAVRQVLPHLEPDDQVVVLLGDVPLISTATINALVDGTPNEGVGIVITDTQDPTGLGRIVRNDRGNIVGIVEHKDASEAQLQIKEINSGIITAPASALLQWLPELSNDNAQGEYYLTDIIQLAVNSGRPVHGVKAQSPEEVQGINNRMQLAQSERSYQSVQAHKFMLQGVSLLDPQRFDVRGDVEFGKDVTVDINVILQGKVTIGNNCYIGANTVLKNVTIADGVTIKENCVIEDAIIGNDCVVGPFARLRPGSQLAAKARIGNFVEVKKSIIGEGSKVGHLTYIGDASIGSEVNVGAGTITCNYDGVNKFHTEIASGAFIGSGTELVAPINVGENAYIAAGSTVNKDVPAQQLTIARAKQKSLQGWRPPEKKKS